MGLFTDLVKLSINIATSSDLFEVDSSKSEEIEKEVTKYDEKIFMEAYKAISDSDVEFFKSTENDLTMQNPDGFNLLMYATIMGNSDVIGILVTKWRDLRDQKNNLGHKAEDILRIDPSYDLFIELNSWAKSSKKRYERYMSESDKFYEKSALEEDRNLDYSFRLAEKAVKKLDEANKEKRKLNERYDKFLKVENIKNGLFELFKKKRELDSSEQFDLEEALKDKCEKFVHENYKQLLIEKDEFETTTEYEERLSEYKRIENNIQTIFPEKVEAWRKDLKKEQTKIRRKLKKEQKVLADSIRIFENYYRPSYRSFSLSGYNADNESFTITLGDHKNEIIVPRNLAKNFKNDYHSKLVVKETKIALQHDLIVVTNMVELVVDSKPQVLKFANVLK